MNLNLNLNKICNMLFSTSHKDIGTLYLGLAFVLMLIELIVKLIFINFKKLGKKCQ